MAAVRELADRVNIERDAHDQVAMRVERAATEYCEATVALDKARAALSEAEVQLQIAIGCAS